MSNKSLIAGKMIPIMCDNLVAVGILNRRLSLVDCFDNGIVHRLLYAIAGVPFRISYVNSACNAADFLSRLSKAHKMTFGEILETSNCIQDMEFLDKECAIAQGTLDEFLEKSQKNALLVQKAESRNWDESKLKDNYQSSHQFGNYPTDDVMAVMNGNEIKDVFDRNCFEIEAKQEKTDVEVWADKNEEDIHFVKPDKMEYMDLKCPNLFSDDNDIDEDDDFSGPSMIKMS